MLPPLVTSEGRPNSDVIYQRLGFLFRGMFLGTFGFVGGGMAGFQMGLASAQDRIDQSGAHNRIDGMLDQVSKAIQAQGGNRMANVDAPSPVDWTRPSQPGERGRWGSPDRNAIESRGRHSPLGSGASSSPTGSLPGRGPPYGSQTPPLPPPSDPNTGSRAERDRTFDDSSFEANTPGTPGTSTDWSSHDGSSAWDQLQSDSASDASRSLSDRLNEGDAAVRDQAAFDAMVERDRQVGIEGERDLDRRTRW